MNSRLFLLSSIAWLIVLGCNKSIATAEEPDIFETYDAKELIDGIKQGYIDARSYSISATDKELFVYGAGQAPIKVIPMPAAFFYLAVAPYFQRTHACKIHNVTGCRGELPNADMTIRFYNDDGALLLDKEYNTGSNGFVDLWLSRELQNAKREIIYGGKRASKIISTVSGARTCETTMQLL